MQDWRQQFSSPSRIDTFAQYLTGKYWGFKDKETGEDIEFTDNLFIDELLKKFVKTPEMEAGTALHKLLELSPYGELTTMIGINGQQYQFQYCFDNQIEVTLPFLRETKISRTLNGITINGIVDAITGTTIWDHKFTKQINYDKYFNSWQWRIYLYVTGLDKFIYNCFQGKVLEQTVEPCINHVRIDKFESFAFDRYASLDQDVEDFYMYYWEVLDKLKSKIMERIQNNI